MSAEEKAKLLILEYRSLLNNSNGLNRAIRPFLVKSCAKLCADKILASLMILESIKFWEIVVSIIDNMPESDIMLLEWPKPH